MKVLFVCLGNICRSPAAEGIMKAYVERSGLKELIDVDSAGTGDWHVDEPPDARMIEHAKKRGYDLSQLSARQFSSERDFETFDLILTMDENNRRHVLGQDSKKQFAHKVKPFVEFCEVHSVKEVPDPYYKDDNGFELVLDILEDGCAQLLKSLERSR